ncbi:hypothetical protein F4820DRAFT_451836 [Hypoxylon rubiginosum]|uniref:Uncharacterized protein n=1 Tax=Hypoxylon rubiginosum TaxID=110542 RepID=A0ACB9YQR6_9PEZI|nr:hypothetical protein F4820DRAFT_451836 [Hypoxylon rubiginosum]
MVRQQAVVVSAKSSAVSILMILPGSLVYGSHRNKPEDNEAFSRGYLAEVAEIHARNIMEMYQQVFTLAPYRAALGEMNRRGNRGWVIDVDKYVDGGQVVNLEGGRSTYTPWSELRDLSTAYPAPASVFC